MTSVQNLTIILVALGTLFVQLITWKIIVCWVLVVCIQFLYTLIFFAFQANLIIQEAKLGVAQADLDAAQATLDEKQAELDEVQALYDAAMKEKQVRYYFRVWFDIERVHCGMINLKGPLTTL